MPVDTSAPVVLSFSPVDGATAAAIGSNIVLTFNEAIQKGVGAIVLRLGSATGAIVESFDAATSSRVTATGSTLTIDPTINLSADTPYFVTFAAGTVKDLAGNSYAGTTAYDFKTAPGYNAATNLGAPSTAYFGLTGDNIIDATTNGFEWALGANRTVDFAVANGLNGEYWNEIGLTADYLNAAVQQFSYFANVKFNFSGIYTNPIAAYSAGSEITLSIDGVNQIFSSSNQYAVGFFPNASYNSIYQGAPGDLYINLSSPANSLPSYLPGSEGWFILIHELGHALGLKHPHDGGGTGRPTFDTLGLGSLDMDLATIMSYNDDAGLNQISWDPATPMILDVYALQYLYGKNTTVNSGNSVYTLLADGLYKTLWDPSGIDTLDASQNTAGWTIELPETSLSKLVDTRAGYAVPTTDLYLAAPHSLTWLAGDYENVIGTGFADVIKGNLFNNTIKGGGGNDQIDGGAGCDICIFTGSKGQYQINAKTGVVTDSQANRDGLDTLSNIERLQFSDLMVGLDVNAGQNTGEVYRLYLTVLGRNPREDSVGCGFWIDKLDKGLLSTEQLVGNFLNSSEFISRFGAATSANESFVNLMYLNLLGRDGHPDSGFNFWLNVLNNHQASREQVVVSFMESAENIANAAPLIGDTPTFKQWLG